MEPTTVGQAMRREVVCARPEMLLTEAAQLLYTHRINGMPVVDDLGHVVGMVGIKDILRAPFRSGDEVYISTLTSLTRLAAQLGTQRVAEVMAWRVSAVSPEELLSKVMAQMVNRGIHPIPVVDQDRRLLGILGRADVLDMLLAIADANDTVQSDDEPQGVIRKG
jgi:CBS domain-containing membrane protein